jgi:hypothetical protein
LAQGSEAVGRGQGRGALQGSDERLLSVVDRFARPPGPLYLALVVLAATGFVWAGAQPFFGWSSAVLPGSALLLGIVIWFVRWRLEVEAPEPSGRRRGRVWFAVPALVTLVAMASLFTDTAWNARWAVARPAFDRAVTEGDRSARSIGSIPIDGVRQADGATWFAYGGREVSFFLSSSETQIVYSPEGRPRRPPGPNDRVDVQRLGRDWYLVVIWSD